MKKLVLLVSIVLLSGCASMYNTQLYEGKPKPRSEVSVFTTEIPKDYGAKRKYLSSCGGIRKIGDTFFAFSPQNTVELLPGTYDYRWERDLGYAKAYGDGKITVGKNELHVLVCEGNKYYVIKMPYKLTDTDINARKPTK